MTLVKLDYTPRGQFKQFHNAEQRWACLVCHRRAGKTVASVRHLERGALRCDLPNPRFAYIAPLYKQAKDVAWSYLKDGAAPLFQHGAKANESELRVDYPNGGRVRLYGADNPDAMRGIYLDGVVLDEYADMNPDMWTSVIRPALSDRGGWAVFIGTPKGRDSFYNVWREALKDDNWYTMMLKASESGLLPPEELADARRDMAPNTYNREFECSFDEPDVAQFIDTMDCQASLARENAEEGNPILMGVDIARFGDDQSCIVIRKGDVIVDVKRYRGDDTMQMVGHVARECEQYGPQQVFVDGVGVGGGVVDRLRQLGYPVIDVSAGTKATNSQRYYNLRAEMWATMREWIKTRGKLINDPGLIDDLVAPTYKYDPSNRIMLEKKEDMKKRGMPSPDSGDALALTFAFPVTARPGWIPASAREGGGVQVKTGNSRLDRRGKQKRPGSRMSSVNW